MIVKDTSGTWMMEGTGISCARHLATQVVIELGLGDTVETRERVTQAIYSSVHNMLESAGKAEVKAIIMGWQLRETAGARGQSANINKPVD